MPLKKWTLQYLIAFPLLCAIFASVQYLKGHLSFIRWNLEPLGLLFPSSSLQSAVPTTSKGGSTAIYAMIYRLTTKLTKRNYKRYFLLNLLS